MKSKGAKRRYSQIARAQAAEETARRLVETFLGRLMTDWYDDITLERVAGDSGVTVQTVVRRFGGKEGLLAAAVEVLSSQINAQREAPPGDMDRLVERLIEDYERTGDAVIRLLALESRHAAVKKALEFGRGEHRRWVSAAFADTLGGLEAVVRESAVDELVVLTDVYTWKLLRRDMARSATATGEIMRRMIRSTIAGFSTTESLREDT